MDRWQPTSESREIEREMSEALQWQQLAAGLAERAVDAGWTRGENRCEVCGTQRTATLRCPAGHALHLDCGLIDFDEEIGEPMLVCALCHPARVEAGADEADPHAAGDVFANALELGWSIAKNRRCEVCLGGVADEPFTLSCPQAGHLVHARCCEADADGAPTCPLCGAT
jgi:hypothetical protein